jgi:hypothetical protein
VFEIGADETRVRGFLAALSHRDTEAI